MGDILREYSFAQQIDKRNIRQVIAQAQPEAMSDARYQRIAGYFADSFREESNFQRSEHGDSVLAKIYSHAANVMGDIAGQKSLSHKADKNRELVSFLYFRDEDFRVFIDKFLPDCLIHKEHRNHQHYQPPQEIPDNIINLPWLDRLQNDSSRVDSPARQ